MSSLVQSVLRSLHEKGYQAIDASNPSSYGLKSYVDDGKIILNFSKNTKDKIFGEEMASLVTAPFDITSHPCAGLGTNLSLKKGQHTIRFSISFSHDSHGLEGYRQYSFKLVLLKQASKESELELSRAANPPHFLLMRKGTFQNIIAAVNVLGEMFLACDPSDEEHMQCLLDFMTKYLRAPRKRAAENEGIDWEACKAWNAGKFGF